MRLALNTFCSLGRKLSSPAGFRSPLNSLHPSVIHSSCSSPVPCALYPSGYLPPARTEYVECFTGINRCILPTTLSHGCCSIPTKQYNWVPESLRNFLKFTASKWGAKNETSARLTQTPKGRVSVLASPPSTWPLPLLTLHAHVTISKNPFLTWLSGLSFLFGILTVFIA